MIKDQKAKGLKRSLFQSSKHILQKWKLYNRTEFLYKSALISPSVWKKLGFAKILSEKRDLGLQSKSEWEK